MSRVSADVIWFARTKPELLWTGVAVAVLVGLHAWLILRLQRRLQAVAHVSHRLERLAAATTLLTDTMESGLATLTSEVRQMTRQSGPRPASRTATGKRIAAAAKRGDPVAAIARREALSESEIGLHLAMASRAAAPGGPDGPVRA
jgi:hypothetical protein